MTRNNTRKTMETRERRRIVRLIGESSCKPSLINGKAKPQHVIEKPMMKKKNRLSSLNALTVFILKSNR